jgi:O-antigen/teichoic acid export membrane protein
VTLGPFRQSVETEPTVTAPRGMRAGHDGRLRAAPAARPVGTSEATGSLAGSALWLVSSNLFYAACQWGTIVGLAKLGAPVTIGLLGLALTVATPVVQLSGLGLRPLQATDVLQRYAFVEYLSLRLAANCLAALVIGAAAALGVLEPDAVAILIPIAVAKLAEATSETCYGLAQRHERMRFVAVSRAARGALGLVALVATVALGGTLAEGSWALAAAWTAFLCLVDLPAAALLEPVFARPRRAALWRLTRESTPLGGVNGLFAVGQNVPRYLLGLSHGAAAVGYFTALSAVTPALNQFAAAVCNAAAPRLGRSIADDTHRYRVLVLQLLAIATVFGALLVLGAAIGGRRFLALAYEVDYAAYNATFVISIAAGALAIVNEVLYYALLASRRPGAQLAIECAALLVVIVGGLMLIPHFGVGGAAVAAAAGAAARALLSGYLVLRWRR